jgi:hypothetical protein
VDVYVTDTPKCQLIEINPALRASVSPFQESVMLGDVVAELARIAAQNGATVLHSIRLLSLSRFEGAEVTGKAAACLDEGFGPFDAKLAKAIYEAKSARTFFFSQSELGPLRSVENSKKVVGRELSGGDLDRLRSLVVFAAKNDLPGLRKSCPFEPSIGFQFSTGDVEAWWLVSRSCETAILTTKNDDWRRSPLVNITADTLRSFEQIVH